MDEVNAWWMELTQYELERTDYAKIIFSTVNDYLAIKTNGEVKKKGEILPLSTVMQIEKSGKNGELFYSVVQIMF